jgi:hypothetical protein
MKYILICLAALTTLIVASCAFYPVQSAADFAARQTAQVTLAPPEATATATLAPVVATATEVAVEATLVATPSPECLVKGNIARHGGRVYHLPGDPSWSRTIIDPDHEYGGYFEQWFCSAADAEAAGWRHAKN